MEKMYYLIESYNTSYVNRETIVDIDIICKSRNLSELQEYLHDIYLECLEDDECSVNGEEVCLYDIENGDLPTEYSDKLYISYSSEWDGAACHSYRIILPEDLNKVEEL